MRSYHRRLVARLQAEETSKKTPIENLEQYAGYWDYTGKAALVEISGEHATNELDEQRIVGELSGDVEFRQQQPKEGGGR